MINRQMKLLDLIRLLLRNNNGNVRKGSQFSAVSARKAYDLHSIGQGSYLRIHDILRISGGADTEEDISPVSVTVDLLGIAQYSIHIIGKSRGQRHMVCQRNGRKGALKLLRKLRSPLGIRLL